MDYKVIELNENSSDISVELRFAIASERAGGCELLRIDILKNENKKEQEKLLASINKLLKQMKEERLIQFFATKKNFDLSTMEAEFLLNKYPSVFICDLTDNPSADFVYIKI